MAGVRCSRDEVMDAAALDRLLHRCTVLNIRGESYRLKEKRQAGVALEAPAASTRAEKEVTIGKG